MNLAEPCIRRPVMTILIMVAIIVAGLMAFNHLPVSSLPDVDYPTIQVTVHFPGASPNTMANTVATPLEKEFMLISGMTSVTSSNTSGKTQIALQFDISKSMDSAAQDVEAAISRAKAKLPPHLPNDPTYEKVNPSTTPILYLVLTSDTVSEAQLYVYGNTFIGQQLSMINGVAQVTTYGSPYAVRVQVNPHLLAHSGITLNDVEQALVDGNPYLPTGELNSSVLSSTVVAQSQMQTADAYNSLVVAYRHPSIIRIRDLGAALDSLRYNKYSIHYMDQQKDLATVVLAIQRQPDANTVKVADAIKVFLPTLASQLPASVELQTLFDQSQSIRDSIEEVEMTLLMTLILVVFVIFLYLGQVRETLIPSLVLPMSIIGTWIVMYLLGYSINNLTLLALILAVGFIVDDAIVVLENIVRHIEQGKSPWMAALDGSKQIGFTILAMTLSLIAVFIPMVLMGGLIGKIFQEFAITLISITLISGVLSLTLTPLLCSRLIVGPCQGHSSRMEHFAKALNQKLLFIYKPALNWMLDHCWVALIMGLVSIGMSGYYLYTLPKDFLPQEDIGFILAYTQSAQGTPPSRMIDYQALVAHVIRQDPNVDALVSIGAYPQYRNGILFIRLKPHAERRSADQILQTLYTKLLGIPGINTYLKNVPLIDLSIGTQVGGNYQYTLQSVDSNVLYETAEKLIRKMQSLPGFQGVSSDLEMKNPQLSLDILRDQASSLGISAVDIEKALQLAYGGGCVTRIQTPIDQYDVILEVEPHFQESTSALSAIYLRSKTTGQFIPLSTVVHWEEGVGPASVNHIAQFPSVTISFNLEPGFPLGTALARLRQVAEEILPSHVIGQVKGAAETFEESMQNIFFLLLVAVFAIYVVLGILYESFIHPLTILSTLPPAILGALMTLAFFGLPLSLYAYLGIILLIGIVKKNGIMIVDYALENERIAHQTPREAIYHACLVRFRPIMMTTMTAIVGALPIALAFGSCAESRRSLGLVIMGGMLFSQLITLLMTPVIYLYLDKMISPTKTFEILKK